jgi:hypothetical protein
MRAALLSALVLLFAVVGCSQRHPISTAVPPPALPPATIQRTLIETPPPVAIPNPPLPALKPGTELSLAESEALADQAPNEKTPVASALRRLRERLVAEPRQRRRIEARANERSAFLRATYNYARPPAAAIMEPMSSATRVG